MVKIIDHTINGQASYTRLSSEGIRSSQQSTSRKQSLEGVDELNDKVMLSEMSRKMSQAIDTLHQLNDVRQDRVSLLRSSLEAGTYRPDPEQIAGKMMAEMLANRSMASKGCVLS